MLPGSNPRRPSGSARGLWLFEAYERSGEGREAIEDAYRARVAYWSSRIEEVESRRLVSRAGFVAGALIIAASLTLGPPAWAVAMGVGSWMIWRSLGVGRWRRLVAQVRHGQCLSCGYHLGAAGVGSVSAGPARCPECGAAWPRVPPPMPDEGATIDA